jgi:hypothetical protein
MEGVLITLPKLVIIMLYGFFSENYVKNTLKMCVERSSGNFTST